MNENGEGDKIFLSLSMISELETVQLGECKKGATKACWCKLKERVSDFPVSGESTKDNSSCGWGSKSRYVLFLNVDVMLYVVVAILSGKIDMKGEQLSMRTVGV